MEKFDDNDDDDNSATSVQQQRWSEKIDFTILEIGRNWAEIDDERTSTRLSRSVALREAGEIDNHRESSKQTRNS
ncbi:hypothetical protein T03_2108 [Trichinella britovi]|uniref:Uncharacterized protein n=1 Tax=Trichinella britovi TaxID=45882 RepID=A0A0V1D5Y8_TRIBR|nr:hypothetical protein T03_2108 [Trichinella britovi]